MDVRSTKIRNIFALIYIYRNYTGLCLSLEIPLSFYLKLNSQGSWIPKLEWVNYFRLNYSILVKKIKLLSLSLSLTGSQPVVECVLLISSRSSWSTFRNWLKIGSTGSLFSWISSGVAGDPRFSTGVPGMWRVVGMLGFSCVELATEEEEDLRLSVWPLVPLVVTFPLTSDFPLGILPASNWFLRALTEGRNFLDLAGLVWLSLLLLLLLESQFWMST